MPTIYVSRRGNSTNLRLRDSEGHDPGNDQITTMVNPSDTVTWQLDPNANPPSQPGYFPIYEIIGVSKADSSQPQYLNSTQVLVSDPGSPVNGVVTGQVKSPSPGRGKFENYQIAYRLTQGGDILTDDPVMQMNS